MMLDTISKLYDSPGSARDFIEDTLWMTAEAVFSRCSGQETREGGKRLHKHGYRGSKADPGDGWSSKPGGSEPGGARKEASSLRAPRGDELDQATSGGDTQGTGESRVRLSAQDDEPGGVKFFARRASKENTEPGVVLRRVT